MQRSLTAFAYLIIIIITVEGKSLAQLAASDGQYSFVQYTPKDGLVNSRVRKAYQDSKGRIYFLTYSGLSIYNGTRFKNYTTQNGLSSDLVNDILEIGNDSFLVATNINALNLLVNGQMLVLKTADSFCPLVNQFYQDAEKQIYASSDYGLFALKNGRFKKLNIRPLDTDATSLPYLGGLSGSGNYLIFSTNDLKSNKGLYLYDVIADRICDVVPDVVVVNISNAENNVWIGLPDKLMVLDRNELLKGKLSLISPPEEYRSIYNNGGMTPSFDVTGMWLIEGNSKIIHLEKNGEVSKVDLPDEVVLAGGIRDMLVDQENTLWLCNDGSGVFKLVNSQLKISRNLAGNQRPVYFYQAYAVKNSTWYKAAGNKLLRQTGERLTEFTTNVSQSPYIFNQSGNRIMGYDARNIYDGIIDEHEHKVSFKKIISLPGSDNFGKRLVVDRYGNIIAGLSSGLAVWQNNRLIYHKPIRATDLIEELAFDKRNLLWVVTRSRQIEGYTLHPESPSNYLQPIKLYPTDSSESSARSFVIDKTGLLWIGTRTKGLFVYKFDNDTLRKLYHFSTSNGLDDDFVTALSCDSLNNILAGTQTGLDRIVHNANYFQIQNVTRSSNFFAYITLVWTTASNQSYAFTNSGMFLQLSPLIKNKKNFSPKVLIEEMRINGHPVLHHSNVFNFRENNLSFSVAAPSFIDEKQITFSYLLEGSGNTEWSDTTAGNASINLVNLSPGKYSLKIKAFFPSTPYLPSGSSFVFEITPPWWQTWWSRILTLLLIVGVSIMILRFYYQRKLEKQKVKLEKQKAIEKERTRIATDMHDDLGAGLSRIKFLSETIGIKRQQQQPIEEDINKIREYSHEMIDKMGEIVWALNEKNDSLSDLLSYTRVYAVEYLSQNGIDCHVVMPDGVSTIFVSGEFRRNVFLSVKEALHNVVKHSQADSVVLTIEIDKHLTTRICDNGIGFDKKNLRPFSNGVHNIEKRMEEIGGSADIQNKNGTVVTLKAPL